MRLLFTTWSGSAHLAPLVPLASACAAAGHDVLFAVPAGSVRDVAAAGLPVAATGSVPVPTGAPEVARPPGRWPSDWPSRIPSLDETQRRILTSLEDRQAGIAEGMLPDLLPLARKWRPDIIVADASTYAGTVVASNLGVPLVCHQWGGPAVLDLGRGAGYRRLFDRFGADPAHHPDVWAGPCPPSLWLPSPATRWAIRYQPALAGASGFAVCVTWEPNARITERDPLLATGIALADAGVPTALVVTPSQRADLPTGLPVLTTLPRCEVLLHQGNGMTGMAAASAGIAQAIVSPRPEQLLIGDRLAAAGAGWHLRGSDFDGDVSVIRDGVLSLRTPAVRSAAAELRREIEALPAPAEAVGMLTALASAEASRSA
ncbi:glycosyltransferase [Amycolatopsis sp. NPDC059657]|uniref:glycosyltransferase n=1 Tax=Amycolatopsis sp. NPDC059657 TaxID=3346899 RepID=UPI00366B9B3B